MTRARIVGLDPSLAAFGVAGATWTECIRPGDLRGHERIAWLLLRVREHVCSTDLAVIEGPSYGSASSSQAGHHERAGLWWHVTHQLWREGVPYAVVSPSGLKKYALAGRPLTKERVLSEAVRRFPWFDGDNNEADALWLCAMAHDLLGEPLLERTAKQREALTVPAWPVLVSS